MKAIVLLLLLLSVSLLYPNIAAAQVDINQQYDVLRLFIQMLWGSDFPSEAYTLRGFLQFVIFPFIGLFAIMYGILSEIKVFRTPGGRKAQILIALMSSFLGGWYAIGATKYLLQANAILGTVAFGVLFFIGILVWAYGRFISMTYEHTGRWLDNHLKKEAQMEKLRQDLQMYLNAYAQKPDQELLNIIRDTRTKLDNLQKDEKHDLRVAH